MLISVQMLVGAGLIATQKSNYCELIPRSMIGAIYWKAEKLLATQENKFVSSRKVRLAFEPGHLGR